MANSPTFREIQLIVSKGNEAVLEGFLPKSIQQSFREAKYATPVGKIVPLGKADGYTWGASYDSDTTLVCAVNPRNLELSLDTVIVFEYVYKLRNDPTVLFNPLPQLEDKHTIDIILTNHNLGRNWAFGLPV